MSNLNSQFVIETDSKTDEKNILVFDNVRISVILPGVIRIEKGVFCDKPTQSFWYRNHGKVNFTSEKQGNKVTIKTEVAEFCVNISSGKPFVQNVTD